MYNYLLDFNLKYFKEIISMYYSYFQNAIKPILEKYYNRFSTKKKNKNKFL